ncbi:MAG: L,D-transpeptidase family protein, partial [Phycisphaerales bacterium JB064]
TLIQQAEAAIKANDPITARERYNQALLSDRATAADRAHIREQMANLNQDLIFSPRVYPDDPFATVYEVQGGDSLAKIAQSEGVATEWLLIQRVNRLSNPNNIYKGQKLKLVRGPFHAVVSKSAFRMDVYVGPPEEIDQWVYVRSFRVGLGEQDGTPLGAFKVRRHSKLINPFWRNPRTGEEFAADDPANPIGEHWVGLRGLGQAETFSGYGIHGTVEPESIGRSMSMGCVRMLPEDVALVYELLTEDISEVHIVE